MSHSVFTLVSLDGRQTRSLDQNLRHAKMVRMRGIRVYR